MDYIIKLVNLERTNYNDFIHCIWFCISGPRLDHSETEIIKKLKGVYKGNIMPIIFVYLQAIDMYSANHIGNYIWKEYNELNFITVLAKDIGKYKAFGNEELLGKTIEESAKSLQGRMFKLMTQKILKDIKIIMLDNNEKNRIKVNKYIINEFIGNYKIVKSDKDFIGYIVDILKKNLLIFYERYKKNISNNTLNLLYSSDLINEVKKCIQVYKKELKKKINTMVEKKANDFICLQADIEKRNDNMHIENKRRLKEFKKTNRKYFKQNYYFICQKYIINKIIQNYMIEYSIEIKNKIDKIIKDLLTSNDEEIRFHLENCFLNKLKNFAEKANIHHKIKRNFTRIFEDYPLECKINKKAYQWKSYFIR